MTREELYARLQEKAAQTDWNDLASIKEYNEYARIMREMLREE